MTNNDWHARSAAETIASLSSTHTGLEPDEATRRLERFGHNRLPVASRDGWLRRFSRQFHNVLIYLLLGAATITALLDHWVDCGVIVSVVFINALIGVIQEGRAERALDAIRNMLSLNATVLRGGRRQEVPAHQLVTGDIVLLASGDKVPADLRLVEVRQLRIEEATLTGESEPVEKGVAAVDPQTVLGERACMAYSGTLVVYGQARGVVVAIGTATEIGHISSLIAGVGVLETPLLRQMTHFGKQLTTTILLLAGLTFAFGVWVHGYNWSDMFFAAVGLAVAAIPEGLPAVLTITLALGVQRMAKRSAIVRRLPAVESLGAVTTICSDKTGTLTKNEMTVQRVITASSIFEVSGIGYAPHGGFAIDGKETDFTEHPDTLDLFRAGLLCNDAALNEGEGHWHIAGDPTEGALIPLALKAGLDAALEHEELPRTDHIPFESEHRFMATLHHDHSGHAFIFVKGAVEQVLAMCNQQRGSGEDVTLDLPYWHAQMAETGARGQRVLALAMKSVEVDQRELRFADVEGGFTLLGMVGISDPPREEAISAVRDCKAAGIRVKMITGDHADTARAIAAQLGIGNGLALTGVELDAMDDEALRQAVRDVDVFARSSPEHKLRLVTAMQANGEVVAMTGDGVNDAPALKRADVGVAMGGKGTEAAKEAAEMVLADDNFASIAAAVEEGRTIYDNLKKSIVFILPTSGGEAAVIVAAILMGLTLPITPVQILWVNMVTAITLSLALAFESSERGVMCRAPQDPRAPLLDHFLLWRIVLVSALMVLGGVGFFLWELGRGASLEEARTVAVNALVMGEIFYLFNCRHLFESSFGVISFTQSRPVVLSIVIVVLLQLLFTYAPLMQHLFGTAAIESAAWWRILLFGGLVFGAVEMEKAGMRRWDRHRISRRSHN
ncbi:cation-transporting P-type ATPase [Ferriphaselus amnicola]|nr:cation-transporting P-type ATPase [Ferriphaselus amnicola]